MGPLLELLGSVFVPKNNGRGTLKNELPGPQKKVPRNGALGGSHWEHLESFFRSSGTSEAGHLHGSMLFGDAALRYLQ